MNKLKPAFPVFYFTVFAYTVGVMFHSYVFADSPPIVDGVVGERNQNGILGITYFYAFMLCIYIVFYYARLEVLEHGQVLSLPTKKRYRIVEFLIRLLLVGVVALKILSYHALNDLFFFSFILCTLLSLWLFYMKIMKTITVEYYELVPNVIILLLSGWAWYISDPELQGENAVLILFACITSGIILTSCILILFYKFGKEFIRIAKNFVVNW